MIKFIHIPKTGGTAIKNAKRNGEPLPFECWNSHEITVFNTQMPVMCSVRDPIKRFCSGFYTRLCYEQRAQLAKQRENHKYTAGPYNRPFSELETEIFGQAKTPNQYVSWLRKNPERHTELFWGSLTQYKPLGLLTLAKLSCWVGNQHQVQNFIRTRKLCGAYNQENLTDIMKRRHGVNMPDNDFQARRKEQFDITYDFKFSKTNAKWLQEYFADDYEILNIIKQSDIYIS